MPVEEAILPAGDVEIVGHGPEGPVLVGVEVKTYEDAITCMRNGRFAEQARGMKDYYQVRWLLVYGRTKSVRGFLSVARGTKWYPMPNKPTESELNAWLMSMAQSTGTLIWTVEDEVRAVLWLRALNNWWQREWSEHQSHLDFYEAPVVCNPFKKPTLALRVASTLPGMGAKKARRAAEHFRSARNIVLASEEEWMHIEGVGKKVARDIVEGVSEEAGAEE